jgi:hypothetical protein
MRTTQSLRRAALACLIALAAGAAFAQHGNLSCTPDRPKAEWRPQMELQKELQAKGWKVRQVKTYNNCYEVYGFDDKGARAEVFFHPKTFEKVHEVPQGK